MKTFVFACIAFVVFAGVTEAQEIDCGNLGEHLVHAVDAMNLDFDDQEIQEGIAAIEVLVLNGDEQDFENALSMMEDFVVDNGIDVEAALAFAEDIANEFNIEIPDEIPSVEEVKAFIHSICAN